MQVVAPTVIGLYRLTLALEGEPITGHVDVRVICPLGLIELADGVSCGCEMGEYLKAGSTRCLPCLPNFFSAEGASVCEPCGQRSERGEPDMGMDCADGVLNGTFAGFWASRALTLLNANESNTFECKPPGVCLGGKDSVCTVGHEGPLCSVCSAGYFVTATLECEPCEVEPVGDGVKGVVLVCGLLLGIAIGFLVMCGAQL